MADFVAIDFETANEDKASACAIGIVKIEKSRIVDTYYSLIHPPELYFAPFNVMIHGITESDVEDEPKFNEIWPNIKPFFEDQIIVAHYAPFDMGVLRATLDKYQILYPSFDLFCTRCISRRVWSSLKSYSLDSLSEYLNITFNHHHACEDARACAQIGIKACEAQNVTSLYELADQLHIKYGYIRKGEYQPCLAKYISQVDIQPTKTLSEFDVSHPFYGKTVVFTGTLKSMARKDAAQKVVDAGGLFHNTITTDTNFLVMGIQAYSIFADGKKSTKTNKAMKLVSQGQDLEIISEDDFLRMLNI